MSKGSMCQCNVYSEQFGNRFLPVRVTSSRCQTKRTCTALEAQQHNGTWPNKFVCDDQWYFRACRSKRKITNNKMCYLKYQWIVYLMSIFRCKNSTSCFWMQMALWVFCELSPPIIIAPQAGIRDGLIALQALLKNRASFLASQAIRSTFSTQITPVPSTLLCARSEDKERDICWMSVQLSASVALQPDALKTRRTIHPSQSTDL